MTRVLTFDGGDKSKEHFTQLWVSFLAGALLYGEEPDQSRQGMKRGKSIEERRRERNIVRALKAISVEEQDENGKPLLLASVQEPSRKLAPEGGAVSLSQPDFDYLTECIQNRYVQIKPTHQEGYLDMIDFVAAADKVEGDGAKSKLGLVPPIGA